MSGDRDQGWWKADAAAVNFWEGELWWNHPPILNQPPSAKLGLSPLTFLHSNKLEILELHGLCITWFLSFVNLQEFSRSLSQTSQHRQSRTKLLFIFFVWKRSIAVYWSLWLPLIIIYPHGLICCWMIPSNILSVLPSTMTRLCCEFIICANPFIIWWWGHLIFTATPKKIEKLQVWKILQSFSLV